VSQCIYCRCNLPDYVPKEHVIPQSFGVFKPDLTLRCVCKECNHYFGSKLEWPMLFKSIEGLRRLQFGHKGAVGSIGTTGLAPTIGEGDDWKGAQVVVRTDRKGVGSTEVLPQVGARRSPSDPFEWVLERDLTAEFAARYSKGSEFRMVGGKTKADNERLVDKLKVVCPTFAYGGVMNPPFSEDGKVLLNIEYTVDRVVARCLCKIGFNYMALTCGETFVLSSEFNDMRKFIRSDVGDEAGRVFVKGNPIIAQEIITGERGTDGHVLTVEGRPADRTLEVQLALFNSIPHKIPMTKQYPGHAFAKGHHFNTETGEVSELEAKYAGPNFDPGKVTW
jgi:HNH endonuclease